MKHTDELPTISSPTEPSTARQMSVILSSKTTTRSSCRSRALVLPGAPSVPEPSFELGSECTTICRTHLVIAPIRTLLLTRLIALLPQFQSCPSIRLHLSRPVPRDRKSTRLNSSHGYISYAVFCLKKKKKTTTNTSRPHSIRAHVHCHSS